MYLRVYEAGHMVPFDQPEVSLAMLDNFIHSWIKEKLILKNEK